MGSRQETTAAKTRFLTREISFIVPTLAFNPFLSYDKPAKVRKTAAGSSATGLTLAKASDHKERTRFINMMRRLNRLQRMGGWTGIIFSESIAPIISRDMSEAEFERVVDSFLAVRPDILKVIKKAWPSYPLLLENSSGIHFYKTSLILEHETFEQVINALCISHGDSDPASSFSSDTDNDSEAHPPSPRSHREGLPVWQWKANSCSLDAVLLLLLLSFTELPFVQVIMEELESNDVDTPRNLLWHKYQTWSTKPWRQWSSASMTAARDQVRHYLEVQQPPITISEESEVTALLHLIPAHLSTTQIERMWEHSVPGCTSENDQPSWAAQEGTRFVVRSQGVTCIHLPGEAHQRGDFQSLVNGWVWCLFSNDTDEISSI